MNRISLKSMLVVSCAIVWAAVNPLEAEDSAEARIRSDIAHLANGESNKLSVSNYLHAPWTACNAAFNKFFTVIDGKRRGQLFDAIIDLAHESEKAKEVPDSERNESVARWLAQVIQEDKDRIIRIRAARVMNGLPPAILQKHKQEIETAAFQFEDWDAILLYGACPTIDMAKMNALLEKEKQKKGPARSGTRIYKLNVILARHGDLKAEKWLLNQLAQANDVGYAELDLMVDSLGAVGSKRVIDAAVQGLESRDIIRVIGGSKVPRRTYYADVLAQIMKKDKSFPTPRSGIVTKEEIDRIVDWTVKHLDAKRPTTPISPLPVIPDFEPLPKRQ